MKISNTSERLKVIMEERQLKQIDILHLVAPYCKLHGIKMNRSDISQYVSGKVEPSQDKLTVLSLALGVSEPWLMGYDLTRDGKDKGTSDYSLPSGIIPISELHFQRVPVIGSVAAGEPVHAPEELGVYVSSPVDCDAALTVHGDSMAPTYQDGDLVYIKCTPDVPDATIAVVFLDDGGVFVFGSVHPSLPVPNVRCADLHMFNYIELLLQKNSRRFLVPLFEAIHMLVLSRSASN